MLKLVPLVELRFRLDVEMSADEIKRGAAVRIAVYIYSRTVFAADVLVEPAVGVTITIKDPDAVALVTDAAMTKQSTGKYSYDWQTTSSNDAGIHSFEITAEDTTYDGFETGTIKLI